MKRILLFLLCLGISLAVGLARASIVVKPVGWTNQGGTIDYNFDTVIDNSGLSSPLNTGDAVPGTLPTHIVPGGDQVFEDVAGRFTSTDSGTATLTFDLGGLYNIDGCIFWNGAEVWGGVYYNERGIDEMTLSFSTDGVNFSGDIDVTPAIIPDGPDPFDAETFSFSTVQATHVRLSDFSNGDDTYAHTAISEIRFSASTNEAGDPSPSNGAEFISVTTDNFPLDDTNTTLSWAPSPEYTGATFNVYFGTTEPNDLYVDYGLTWLNDPAPMTATSIDPSPSGDLSYGTTYYWVVDSYEPNSMGPDILHRGSHWSFTTEPEYPVIVSISPQYLLAELGQDAEFVIDAWDPLDGTLGYQWYKIDAAGDILVGDNLPTLTIEDTQLEDEGTYYCVVSNASPQTATSETALLTIKQLIGWWRFADANDFSGYGNDATVYGAVPAEDGTALEFDGFNDTVSIPAAVFERMVPTQISFSLWQYGYGHAYSNNRIFEATPTWLGVHLPWDGYIYWDAENRIYKAADLTEYIEQWQHWVFTKNADAGTMKIYLNGTLWHSGPGTSVIGDIEAFGIGSSADGTWGFYEGMIKDFRIYNYEISETEVAQIYFDTTGIPTCIERSDYDLDGDCLVNLADLAIAAENYLRCGLYPSLECP